MTAAGGPGGGGLAVAAERTYVVYDGRTGAIRHVHQSITFAGAATPPAGEEEARALAMAARFGHRADGLRVLRVEAFDERVPQRVDVKGGRLVAATPPGAANPGRRPAAGARPGRPARRGPGRPAPAPRRRRG
jgi:hypothetical protein